MKKEQEIAIVDQSLVEQAKANMPADTSFNRVVLPRLSMFSMDQTEGKGKAMKVVAEAGTYYIERASDETDADGKKIYVKTEIGKNLQATVVYFRRQLSLYDEGTLKYTNSPIYDLDTDVVPLFSNKKEVARGTPKDLKKIYAYVDPKDGKTKSKLQDQKILYVLYEGEMYQMTLKGTSMYSWMTYSRSIIAPVLLTEFSSEEKENGSTEWNMCTFKTVRPLDNDEIQTVLSIQADIKSGIKAEKDYFASLNTDVIQDAPIWDPNAPLELPPVKPEF